MINIFRTIQICKCKIISELVPCTHLTLSEFYPKSLTIKEGKFENVTERLTTRFEVFSVRLQCIRMCSFVMYATSSELSKGTENDAFVIDFFDRYFLWIILFCLRTPGTHYFHKFEQFDRWFPSMLKAFSVSLLKSVISGHKGNVHSRLLWWKSISGYTIAMFRAISVSKTIS